MTVRLARILSAVLFLGASAVSASEGLPVANNTYGTAGLTWVTLTPWDFHGLDSSAAYSWTFPTPTFGIYRTGGIGVYEAGLHLPEGALVSVIELAACDTNAIYDLHAQLVSVLKTGPISSVPGIASTAGSSGCQVVSNTDGPFTPWTVNNDTTNYTVQINFGLITDNTLVLNSVRVGYKLQISPDPSTATFADVPVGHPFHRFVEALYASGITGGCGGGNYCPDAPVTRGQMAVFLAGALGLHWAP
jgi:S-layer family protein